jgi:glycosyltransferase involved in cell wall biosynthesis
VRIAIDARELAGRPTGVGRYLGEILAAWGELPAASAHEFILCSHVPVPQPDGAALPLTPLVAAGRGTWWEQLVLPRLVRRAGAHVLFAPGYTGPLRLAVPMVLTIHDVSFAAHPEWFGRREGARRRFVTERSARRAARVITVSDFSKREIVRHLRVDQARVDVIYSGATPLARPTRREPLVLYVGSLFNRRHIPELIEAMRRVHREHPDVRLEIVGDNRTLPYVDVDAVTGGAGAARYVRWRSYVADEALADLYGRASAFVFLSEYEGFGMTPLDALAAGVPIVVLDTPVAREIYGPAALYVERPDPELVSGALGRVLFDGEERARILQAAAAQLPRYSWRECAQRTLQVLLACAASSGSGT